MTHLKFFMRIRTCLAFGDGEDYMSYSVSYSDVFNP